MRGALHWQDGRGDGGDGGGVGGRARRLRHVQGRPHPPMISSCVTLTLQLQSRACSTCYYCTTLYWMRIRNHKKALD